MDVNTNVVLLRSVEGKISELLDPQLFLTVDDPAALHEYKGPAETDGDSEVKVFVQGERGRFAFYLPRPVICRDFFGREPDLSGGTETASYRIVAKWLNGCINENGYHFMEVAFMEECISDATGNVCWRPVPVNDLLTEDLIFAMANSVESRHRKLPVLVKADDA